MSRIPSTPALPDYSTDSTGVLTGNADIGVPEWTGRTERAETPPLPVYPDPWAHMEAGFAEVIGRITTPIDPMATPIPKLPGRAGKEL